MEEAPYLPLEADLQILESGKLSGFEVTLGMRMAIIYRSEQKKILRG